MGSRPRFRTSLHLLPWRWRVPLLIQRIAASTIGQVWAPISFAHFSRTESRQSSQFYFELAQAFSPVNYVLTKLVPTSHVLFEPDYDRFPIASQHQAVRKPEARTYVRRSIARAMRSRSCRNGKHDTRSPLPEGEGLQVLHWNVEWTVLTTPLRWNCPQIRTFARGGRPR